MKWFKHYSDASKSVKLNKLVDKFGLRGYAMYWLTVELLASKFDGKDPNFQVHLNTIKGTFGVYHNKIVKDFMKSLDDLGLMSVESSTNVFTISFPKLLEIKDNHTKNLQAKSKGVSIRTDKNKKKIKIESKERINNHIFDEVIQLFNETLPGKGQIQHYRIHSDIDRRNFVDLVKKQPSFLDIENWRELFELIKDRPKLLGTHSSFNVVANLGWLFIEKNIADIFNGKYERESGASGRTPKTWEEHQREYEEKRRKMGLA